jgi:hypothetical protein
VKLRVHPGEDQPVLDALNALGFELVTEEGYMRRARKYKLQQVADGLAVIEKSLDIASKRRPNVRGTRFEKWLGDFFGVFGFKPALNVVNPGEQIDFTEWLQNVFVIGEARWRAEAVGEDQIRDLFGKLAERPPFAIGLVISMTGFTQEAMQYTARLSGQRTILTMDRPELERILSGDVDLYKWLTSVLRDRLEHPAKTRSVTTSVQTRRRTRRMRRTP